MFGAMKHVAVVALVLVMAAGCGVQDETVPTTSAGPVETAAATSVPTPATTATTSLPPTTTITTRAPTGDGPLNAIEDGIGDPYYPELGNSGYDVAHYTLDLVFDPESDILTGNVTIDAVATSDLHTFNLDFIGFEIEEVLVDAAVADFARTEEELTIRPGTVIPQGESFDVSVFYSGTPQPLASAAISFGVGWSTSPSGQRYVVAEPDGARSWYPANDHPLDKATYTFLVTVPDPLFAAANGTLTDMVTDLGQTTFVWEMADPMAPYLATVVIGDYTLVVDEVSTDLAGVPVRNVLPPDLRDAVPDAVLRQGEMIDFFAELFGPYPFDAYGIAVVDGFPAALETQTMVVFGRPLLNELVIVHELAHQWFGNHVSPGRWQDIWLNEGFASYAEWLWIEASLGIEGVAVGITQERDRFVGSGLAPPGSPPPDDLFNASVYRIGAMTLHALRLSVGDEAFFDTLRTYVARFGGGTATTDDLIAVAEEVSGQDLDALFEAWLFGDDVPEFPVG